jgi:hypothetical protein
VASGLSGTARRSWDAPDVSMGSRPAARMRAGRLGDTVRWGGGRSRAFPLAVAVGSPPVACQWGARGGGG